MSRTYLNVDTNVKYYVEICMSQYLTMSSEMSKGYQNMLRCQKNVKKTYESFDSSGVN